ncbi:hypothetical protein N7519_007019 [Penicillium mononematosum]|uniref:uncharacterized protein n=1 Tax=Penicillium mononematosum TaxID=268346 RepID=UPI002548B600|nr:uncharacterized protein N7519_007019 [Penicillium mononematosum]KAJ6185718.1 hypothetical protein N7519_007019 [Penicillium mononematosum]
MFFVIIPCREFFFSAAFGLLRIYVMLVYAANNVLYERAEAAHQGRQGDESEWGFGQVLPVLLLAIPFSQFVEELCRMYYSVPYLTTAAPLTKLAFVGRSGIEDVPSKGRKLSTERRPSSSHTISGHNQEYYELAVASNRTGLARAWTAPSRTAYLVRKLDKPRMAAEVHEHSIDPIL